MKRYKIYDADFVPSLISEDEQGAWCKYAEAIHEINNLKQVITSLKEKDEESEE